MAKSVQQYLLDAEQKLNDIIRTNKPFERAVKNTVARQAIRIFIEGIRTDGTQTGRYSTKPMYVNPNASSPRKTSKGKSAFPLEGLEPTVGKFGEHIFTAETAWHGVKGTKAGDPHRTTYLSGGYKEFRNRIGRRIDRVNLTLSGDLLSDFCNSSSPKNAVPEKISETEYHVRFKRTINQLKREGLEDRFGIIFNLTAEEKTGFFQSLDFNFRKALADG